MLLSGDVHHAYVSRLRDLTEDEDGASPVYQVVSSPLRHPMPRAMQWVYRAMISRPMTRLTRRLSLRAGVEAPRASWRMDEGPWFDNQIATLLLHGRQATFRLERSRLVDGEAHLEILLEKQLTGGRDWPGLVAGARASAAR